VADPNAKPANQPPAQQTKFTCGIGGSNITLFAENEAEARAKMDAHFKATNSTPEGPVTCTKTQ
jgi:hypothetical protein